MKNVLQKLLVIFVVTMMMFAHIPVNTNIVLADDEEAVEVLEEEPAAEEVAEEPEHEETAVEEEAPVIEVAPEVVEEEPEVPVVETVEETVEAEAAVEEETLEVEEAPAEVTEEKVVEEEAPAAEEAEKEEAPEETDEVEETKEEEKESEKEAPETEKEEEKEVEEEEEIEYGNHEFVDNSVEGVTVKVSDTQAAFPVETTMKVVPVSTDEVLSAIEEVVDGEVKAVKAVDISFWYKGKEFEPINPIKVEIRAEGMDAENSSVVHINDEKVAEVVEANVAQKGEDAKATFVSDAFSVYAVVETGDDGENARAEVIFTAKGNPVETFWVKNSDTAAELEEIIYDPGVGEVLDGQTFLGWHITQSATPSYTNETAPLTIEGVRSYFESLEISEGDKYYVHAMIFNVYHVTFRNELNVTVRSDNVFYPATQEVGTEVSYLVNEPYTPEDPETTNFEGWNVLAGEENIKDYTGEPYNNNTTITITGDVSFGVNTPTGRWMNFVENGSGASFTPPVFVRSGQNTERPETDPTRLGYSFGGWFLEPECENEYTFGEPITSRLTLYAKWIPNTRANYTVIIWAQKVTGEGYDFKESVLITNAPANQTATAVTTVNGTGNNNSYARVNGANKQYTGFHLEGLDTDVTVSPEGNTVVNVYYHRNQISLVFYVWGATGYVEVEGYWRAQGDYYTDPNGAGGTTHVYYNTDDGLWYTEREWVGGWITGHYEYSGTSYSTVYTRGEANRWSEYKRLVGLYGSTFADLEGVTWPGEYDWYANGHGTGGNQGTGGGYRAGDTSGTHTTFMDAFLIASGANTQNFYGRSTQSGSVVRFYKQNENGVGYTLANTVNTSQGGGTFNITDKYDGFHAVQYRVGNGQWQNVGAKNPNTGVYGNAVSYSNSLEIRFDRSLYDLTFMDGTYFDGQTGNPIEDEPNKGLFKTEEDIAYGASIASYKSYDPTADALANGAYAFGGWYVDKSCSVPYEFDKMPRDGITVYAKWTKKQYRIFLHPNVDPSETDFEWGAGDQQETSFRVTYGEMISGGETINGTRTGYELVGWYYDADFKNPFIFDAFAVNDDTVTTAYDKTQPTELDKYGIPKSGQENYNKDADPNGDGDTSDQRYWVNRKLELYAKWRNTLEGANGINVVYDANGGSNAPTDNSYYLDGAKSVAQAASTPADPTKDQFVYWVVQKWNGTEFEDTAIEIYPGDSFDVLKAFAKVEDITSEDPGITKKYTVQLRAEYGPIDVPTPTHIWWYANNETTDVVKTNEVNGEQVEEMQINLAVPIKPATTFEYTGYIFKGWARYEEGATPASPTDDSNLWLVYDEETDSFTCGGKAVTQVAADEKQPYHDLYAVWEKLDQLEYDANGGSGTMDPTPGKTGTKVEVADNGFSRTGYTFTGWNTKSDGTGTDYAEGAEYTLTADDPDNKDVLYAQWEINTHTLTIHYVYEDGSKAADDYTDTLDYDEEYSVTSPTITGYTPDQATVSGNMPDEDVTVTVIYVINSHTLTIHYVYEDGSKAADDYTDTLDYDEEYSVESPVIEGYTADKEKVEGNMPDEDVTVTVTYSINSYTLTIHYVYEDGTTAADDYTDTLDYNEQYSVTSPTITGYTPDQATVSGNMPAENKEVTVTYKINSHTLTIHYVYEDGTTAADDYTDTLDYDEEYSVDSPVIEGYTPSRTVVEGNMPDEDVTVTVIYVINSHTLTIHYVYEDGSKAADDYTDTLDYDEQYSVTSPTIEGYTPDQATVSGNMPDEDVEVTVTYSINSHTLTIHYVYEDGSKAADDYTDTLDYDEEYNVTSPTIEGYTPDQATVSGNMPDEDVTVTVTYSINSYTLTIHYVYEDGTTAADDYTDTLDYDEEYSVDSPVIEGYTADKEKVEGTMPADNVEETVTYVRNETVEFSIKVTEFDDHDDLDGIRPDTVTVIVYADGEELLRVDLDKDSDYEAILSGLDKYNDDKEEIEYTIEVVEVEGYEATIEGDQTDGFEITLTHIPDVIYKYTEGMDAVWTKGSKDPLKFTVKRNYDDQDSYDVHYQYIMIDGVKIDESYYKAAKGSVKETLLTKYLETLSVGQHYITTIFDDGKATTNFTVKEKEQPTPTPQPIVPNTGVE